MARVSRDTRALQGGVPLCSRGQRPGSSAPQVSSWLRGEIHEYIPGHEECRSRKSEISEIIREFDTKWSDPEQEDSRGFHSQSGGSTFRGGGGGGGGGGGTGGNQQRSCHGQQIGSLGSSAAGAGRSQKRARSGGDDSGNTSHKKRSTRPDSTSEHQLKCLVYASDPSKGHRCESASFDSFQSMLEHLLRIHIKPLQCSYCWNRFGRRSERTRHERDVCSRNRNPIFVENRVPDYVLEFAKDVLDSTIDTLGGILYSGGRKQYDFLDNTDEFYTPGTTHLTFPGISVNDQTPQLSSGKNVSPNRNEIPNRNPSFVPSPASRAATRSGMCCPPPAFDEAIPEHYSRIRRPSTLPQVPTRDTPSLTSPNLPGLTYYTREFLNRVEQEFKLAEQAGLESARQLARQVAARIPRAMLLYMAEYQAPCSIYQLQENPSPERQITMASPSDIRSPQISVTNDKSPSYPERASLGSAHLEYFDDWLEPGSSL